MANQLQAPDWTFLSNHSHVLYCISFCPDIRIRDIAAKVRITERAVQRIVVDLEQGGYLKRERVGRQNHYRLERRRHLRHPLEHHVKVGRLLAVLKPGTAVTGVPVLDPQDAEVLTVRRRKAIPTTAIPVRATVKAITIAKKRPAKRLKPIAKKSV